MSLWRWPISTFPRRWPGLGLLLLRVVVGATAIVHGWTMPSWGAATFAIGAGVAVTVGLFTSATAGLMGLATGAIALGWIPWGGTEPLVPVVSAVFVVSMSVAIALLGPGAFSIDARLRGHREIVIPRNTQ